MRRLCTALVAVLVVLSGIGLGRPAHAIDWTSFGVDGLRSRATEERLGARFAPSWATQVVPLTAEAVYRNMLASPAVADGYIAVTTYGNLLAVLRETDGAILWSFRTADAVLASPVISRGWVYVASLDRNVYALRLADGRLMWKRNIGGIVYASPVIVEGSLLVAPGAPTPKLLRLDAETGDVIWQAGGDLLKQSLDSSIAVAQGHVLIGETDGRFHSFSLADGGHQWTVATGGEPGLASPLVVGKQVILPAGGAEARVFVVTLDSGAIETGWPVDITASVTAASAAGDATGTRVGRRVLFSSFAASEGRIVANLRVDDRIDSNGDGTIDLYRLRETVVALDLAAAKVAWICANGALSATTPNQIPGHGLIPTPGIARRVSGDSSSEALVIATSSLASWVAILDARTGGQAGSVSLPSGTRSSAAIANGRLVLATDAGAVVALRSLENTAPSSVTRLRPANGTIADAADVLVSWNSSIDREGDAVRYQLRWDTDGEILHTWAGEELLAAGTTSWRLPQARGGSFVTIAVRAIDARGAYSAWSTPDVFTALATAPVLIGSQAARSLSDAIAMARAGDVIQLGAGVYPLRDTQRPAAGVTIKGAAPHLTTIAAEGLDRAIVFGNGVEGQQSKLTDVTVRGARTAVAVEAGGSALIEHAILRDCTASAVDIDAGGVAVVKSSTLFRNDVGATSAGKLEVRGTIVTANRRGLAVKTEGRLTSRYNDVVGNSEMGYDQVKAGDGDMVLEVCFKAKDQGDLRLRDAANTSDKGDPADDFSREPAPNGSRVNVGAFAGTELAELSSAPGAPPAVPASHGGGCQVATTMPGNDDFAIVLAMVVLGMVTAFARRASRKRG